MPCHMKAFVDLSDLPLKAIDTIGVCPGVYCFVETTVPHPDRYEHKWSKLWSPVLKQASDMTSFASTNSKLVLVSIDQLLGPATLVPDHGNEDQRAYLHLVPPREWAGLFNQWLAADHTREWDRPAELPEEGS